MNTKSIAAVTTLVAGTGVIAAGLFVTRDRVAETQSMSAPQPDNRPQSSDLFSADFIPGPASVFIKTAGGQPIPARSRDQIDGMIGMMASLIGRMDEFDLDGDGMLSDLEKVAMGFKLRKEFLADHDLDADGKMSRDEWRAFQRSMFEQTPQGQQLMTQFDANGDGVLSEEEQAALDAHLDQREQDRKSEERARMDTDDDGDVSEDERRAARQQEREFWQNQMRAAESSFDYDDDNELNIEESQDAWDAWVEYQTVDSFITRYDSDGDHRMGPADYDQFLSDYDRKNTSADVNNDGQIDVADIYAFRNLLLRSRIVD